MIRNALVSPMVLKALLGTGKLHLHAKEVLLQRLRRFENSLDLIFEDCSTLDQSLDPGCLCCEAKVLQVV